LVLWRNPNFDYPKRARYNTSMMLLTAGCRPELYEGFDPDRHPAEMKLRTSGTDQAWISHKASAREAHWDAKDGVLGAARGKGIGVEDELPEGARIVFFPGPRIPSMASCQERFPWIAQHLPQ
jgi:hypothetical protein